MFGDEITITGNNGANYVKIKKIDDNRMHLEVGDCCVIIINVVITAEAFSGFLAGVCAEANKDFLELLPLKLKWGKEINEKYLKDCKYFDQLKEEK